MIDPSVPVSPKFKEDGRDATLLDCTPKPVYYGFNCTPRQVRYYKLDKSVETILNGGFTRQSVQAFLEKVKAKQAKAIATSEGYDEKIKNLRIERDNNTSSVARNLIRKKINQLETRSYNYECEVVDKYDLAVTKLEDFLK